MYCLQCRFWVVTLQIGSENNSDLGLNLPGHYLSNRYQVFWLVRRPSFPAVTANCRIITNEYFSRCLKDDLQWCTVFNADFGLLRFKLALRTTLTLVWIYQAISLTALCYIYFPSPYRQILVRFIVSIFISILKKWGAVSNSTIAFASFLINQLIRNSSYQSIIA